LRILHEIAPGSDLVGGSTGTLSFLGGIARKNGFKALMVGGTENHVHILLSLRATMPLAKAVQLVKGASSRRMNKRYTRDFAWQGRIWGFHRWNFTEGRYDFVHPIPGRASSQAEF
jgi:putative transposase